MPNPTRSSPLLHAAQFRRALLAWYRASARDLPWRRTSDPYAVWLSEIMLQQTRVDQGLPYFERFIAAFPTVRALAAAREDRVLKLWKVLLHAQPPPRQNRCREYNDASATAVELQTLPGVGRGTPRTPRASRSASASGARWKRVRASNRNIAYCTDDTKVREKL